MWKKNLKHDPNFSESHYQKLKDRMKSLLILNQKSLLFVSPYIQALKNHTKVLLAMVLLLVKKTYRIIKVNIWNLCSHLIQKHYVKYPIQKLSTLSEVTMGFLQSMNPTIIILTILINKTTLHIHLLENFFLVLHKLFQKSLLSLM